MLSKSIMTIITFFTLAAITSISASAAGQQYRQHEAHEHGTAQLNIAQEKNLIYLELSSPAMNIIGFEHNPSNNKQRIALKRALQKLQAGVQLFLPSPEAKCQLSKVEVESSIMDTRHHHDDGHADFMAHYVFQCQQPAALLVIELGLFKQFPGIEELQVQLLTDRGQTVLNLHTGTPVIKLK